MNINDRVKYLRKEVLNLTQQDFADQIDLGRATIGNIEIGKINLTDRNVKAVCDTFNISEKWLRTGNGEMFLSIDEDEALASLFGQFSGMVAKDGKDFEKALMIKIMKFMLTHTEEEWKPVKEFIKEMADLVE